MAQYRTHAIFNIALALPLSLLLLSRYGHVSSQNLFFFSAAFSYATFFMNPDLDMAGQIKLFSWKGILTFPFRLYSGIFRHRGISHTFPFGTITRVVWLMLFILAIFFLTDSLLFFKTHAFKAFLYNNKAMLLYMLLGLSISDIAHLFLDLKKTKL